MPLALPARRRVSCLALVVTVILWGTPPESRGETAGTEAGAGAEEDGPVRLQGELGLVSDYVDRGISNSDGRPALQGGLTSELDLDSEGNAVAYLDIWGSSVDLDDGGEARVELDLSVGLASTLGDSGLDVDVAATYILYPGADGDLDYNYVEFPLALGYTVRDDLYLNLGYTFAPDYSGNVGRAHYFEALASWTLPLPGDEWPVTLDTRLGHQWFESNSMAGLDDYLDWGLGLTLTLARIDLGLHYTETSLGRSDCYDGSDACGARLVLSAAVRF